MSAPPATATNRWAAAWPDAVAFAGGLGLAWFFQWNTRDLIWSLWLSSLTVGYAMIVWGAFSPALLRFREKQVLAAVLSVIGGFATLLFFTVHFGGFHFVHAGFLNMFFPVLAPGDFPDAGTLLEVVRRYGWFVPVAALAERAAFRVEKLPPEPPPTSVKAADIAARKARQGVGSMALFLPYKNVVRLHLLIFFFAAARYWKLESFAVYAVVYAAYFFPWRLLGAGKTAGGVIG